MADYNNTMTEEELRKNAEAAGLEDIYEGVADTAPVVAAPTYSEPPQQTHWYENVFRKENAEDAPISEEERKKLRRRERAEKAIAAFGDLGTHIANVWGAAKGANPAQINTSLSEGYKQKWKEYGQDLDQRRKSYNAGLAAAQRLDYQQYLADRRQYLAEKREERMWEKQRADKAYRDVQAELTQTKIDILNAKSEGEKKVLEEKAKLLTEQARYWSARANQPYNPYRGSGRSSGGSSNSGASKPNGSYRIGNNYYKNANDYHQALKYIADQNGVEYKVGRSGAPDYYRLEERLIELGILKREDLMVSPPPQNISNNKGTKKDDSGLKPRPY